MCFHQVFSCEKQVQIPFSNILRIKSWHFCENMLFMHKFGGRSGYQARSCFFMNRCKRQLLQHFVYHLLIFSSSRWMGPLSSFSFICKLIIKFAFLLFVQDATTRYLSSQKLFFPRFATSLTSRLMQFSRLQNTFSVVQQLLSVSPDRTFQNFRSSRSGNFI